MRPLIFAAALALIPAMAAAQQAPTAQPPVPRTMSRSALEAEVTRLRTITQNGAVLPAPATGCLAAENHQLDFWIGEWTVSAPNSDLVVAESTIRPLNGGCMIFEEWRPFQGPGGHSISSYDASDRAWHQEWVDGAGARTPFKGAFANGVMALDNLGPVPQGAPANLRRRMSYTRIDDNTVRQFGERFNETTQHWDVQWDLIYKRRPGTH